MCIVWDSYYFYRTNIKTKRLSFKCAVSDCNDMDKSQVESTADFDRTENLPHSGDEEVVVAAATVQESESVYAVQAVSVTQRVEGGTRTWRSRRKTVATKRVGGKRAGRTRISKKTKGRESINGGWRKKESFSEGKLKKLGNSRKEIKKEDSKT